MRNEVQDEEKERTYITRDAEELQQPVVTMLPSVCSARKPPAAFLKGARRRWAQGEDVC
jgi:hypothetical protein